MSKFTWSYSKLRNYETCPKRHYEVDLQKNYTDESDQLVWGNRVHGALAEACSTTTKLDTEFESYEPWVQRVRTGSGELFVEQKYAITNQFEKTSWFAPNVWFRGIGDVVRVAPPVALTLDWKTGKILHDGVQLMLMAQCIFSYYPEITKVRAEFVWLAHDCSTPEVYTRRDIAQAWGPVLDRVKAMEQATVKQDYPPKPSYLCKKYCPVVSCPFYRKGGF